MKVAFRVDASILIGSGHVMRCLTLADALKLAGSDSIFISTKLPGNLIEYIKHRGYGVYQLEQPTTDLGDQLKEKDHYKILADLWEADVKQTRSVVSEYNPDWLVIDHYAFDFRWHQEIGRVDNKVFVIDDLANRKVFCDLLLDQNYGRQNKHYNGLIPNDSDMLLGSNYALLRSEFISLREAAIERRSSFADIRTILISMGGMDARNITENALASLESVNWKNPPEITVVLNSKAPFIDSVKQCAFNNPLKIDVATDVDNMAELMVESDMAIGAGGTSSWERCCLGLPAMIINFAENQKFIAHQLESKGVLNCLGDIDDVSQLDIKNNMDWFIENPIQVKEMMFRCFDIVDGLGVNRVISKMEQLV